jgi:hypothetical protein
MTKEVKIKSTVKSHACQNDYYEEGKIQVLVRIWRKGSTYTMLVRLSITTTVITEHHTELLPKAKK